MKKYFFLFSLIASFFALPAFAQELTFTGFHSDITVNTDASISVTETITADFSTPHHGIYRTIPFTFSTTDGSEASIPIVLQSVEQDGQRAKYSTNTDQVNLTIKIGDPNRTITGSHEYVIHYNALVASNFFPDHDELFWNVTGTQWDAPISNISTTVHLPSSFTSDQVTTTCYTGPYGSRAQNCQQAHTGDTATFSSNEYLTIVVGWPVGVVTKPGNFATLRTEGATTSAGNAMQISTSTVISVIVGILILFVILFLLFFSLKGKRDTRPIIPQYDAPKDVRPGEASVLVSADDSTAISATIVDLAVRGFLRIEETSDPVFLGLGHTHGYDFVELKQPDESLRPFERQTLDALFRQQKYPAVNGRISLSTFKNHRTSTYESFADITDLINRVRTERGWYVSGTGWRTFVTTLSPVGRDLLWYLKGFRLFLKTAEQYRLQWQEREGIFEQFLPYAMVLGVAHHWCKALASMTMAPPDWYKGDFSNGFSTLVLWTSLSTLSTQVGMSGVSGSVAASGGSGFGGGGFSGGGGGGGGGGGW